MPRKIEISHKTILFTFFLLGFVWFLYHIRDILLQLFVALLLMAIFNPLVRFLSRYKIPKVISVAFSYVTFFAVFGFVVSSILPPLIEQTTNLANNLPNYVQGLALERYLNDSSVKELVSQLGSIPGQIIRAVVSLFGNVLSIISVVILSFYLLLNRDSLEASMEKLFGKDKSKDYIKLVDSLENKLGGWARGQFFLMITVGLLSYIGFLVLGVPYALPLALFAGVLEIVPYVGPIIAAVPAAILGFSVSPFLGFATIALSVLIQQIENYLLVPKIMEKSTGVSPIVTLLALAVGFNLAGVVGMIISIPIVIIIQSLLVLRLQK